MRIVGNIEHDRMKITVFQMDAKLSVKFENAFAEVTFKLKDNPMVNDLESVKDWVDQRFFEEAEKQLSALHQIAVEAFKRKGKQAEEETFDEII